MFCQKKSLYYSYSNNCIDGFPQEEEMQWTMESAFGFIAGSAPMIGVRKRGLNFQESPDNTNKVG